MKFCIEDGVLRDFQCDEVRGYITIPRGVRVIGEAAFADCEYLYSVIIPDTVERIERDAFCGCSSLSWVLIPDSVKYIGPYAFADCRELNHIPIPESVTEIDPFAFWIYKPWDEYLTGGPYYLYGKRGGAAERFAHDHPFIFRENKADDSTLMIGRWVYDRPNLTTNRNGDMVLIRQNEHNEWGISAEGYPFERCHYEKMPRSSHNYDIPIPWVSLYDRIDELILLARSNGFTDWADEYGRIRQMCMEMPKDDPELLRTAVSVETMREADRNTIAKGTPSRELMQRAAQGVYDAYWDWDGKSVAVICGSGNNAGDGYALAEILHDHGVDVRIFRVCEGFSDDGAYYYKRCMEKEIPSADWLDYFSYDIYVDCLLGTGFHGVPREPIAEVIRDLNYARSFYKNRFVISVDINSGMNGDTGEAELAVVSNLTVSIGNPKRGLLQPHARELIGELVNVDIGIEIP